MRAILHSDLNSFYASVECLYRPEIRDKPVVVGGDVEARHGIVLTKNQHAKPYGIKTGEAIWQAKQKCPHLVVVPPNYSLYLRYSQLAREIYQEYTSQIESFGIDECWLDVTQSEKTCGNPIAIAETIRARIKEELGVTVSIGVSFNKIFAKLGSDMKKPDAVTCITPENFRDTVWPLPVEELLYVGPATKRKLHRIGATTIGALAKLDASILHDMLGKWGYVLSTFANGLDTSPVAQMGDESIVKSIGNSTTCPRDLVDINDVSLVMYVLCESVSMRLREHGLIGKTLQIYVRDCELCCFERQGKLLQATCLSGEIHEKSMQLFAEHYDFKKQLPLRSVGVRVSDLIPADSAMQLHIFRDESRRQSFDAIERTVIDLRRRYGYEAVLRGALLTDPKLGKINPKDDHIIHPIGFFKEGAH